MTSQQRGEIMTETKVGPNQGRARRTWIVLISTVALLVALAVWNSARMSLSMSTAASDDQQFAQTAPGTNTKIAVEIAEPAPEGTAKGKLLQKKTEEIYARTSSSVTLRWNAQTKIVMGKEADIHPGAVVHVTGTVRSDHTIQAEQLVILTGYVKVQ
jgi:uncharacterized protein YdeI (BOF family)